MMDWNVNDFGDIYKSDAKRVVECAGWASTDALGNNLEPSCATSLPGQHCFNTQCVDQILF